MKERPILFSGAMVRAILEGRKTQTRRAVKRCGLWETTGGQGMRPMPEAAPYGQPGDRLWVRETWAETDRGDGTPVVAYAAGGCVAVGREGAHGPDVLLRNFAWDETPTPSRWRPSIHMPRWACRLVLEITDLRVERLQAISEDDALAEGIDTEGDDYLEGEGWKAAGSAISPERYAFASLWRRINGDASWDANPWVWVVGFRRVEA